MEDKDLAVSVILGLDFLQKSKMVLDFNTGHFHLPDVAQKKCTFPFIHKMDHPTTIFTWLSWIQMSLLSSVKQTITS